MRCKPIFISIFVNMKLIAPFVNFAPMKLILLSPFKKVLFASLIISLLLLSACNKEEKTTGSIQSNLDSLSQNSGSDAVSIESKIDSFFSRRYKLGLFNGAVLFADNGNVIYKNTFGFANYKTKDTLTTNSAFQLASATKPITAYAILLLKEKGLISYSDSVRKFFPEFPYENITIEQLLIHRSGLPNYMYFADEYWFDKRNITINNFDVIDLFIEYEPQKYYDPDQRYNYSNSNYCLLAAIIEKASGKTYADFMEENIFSPLGMKDAYVYNKEMEPENNSRVIGYVTERRIADNSYLNGVVGDKGIYSSVEDLFKFDRELSAGALVSKKEIENAFTARHKELHAYDNYGYGWRIIDLPGSRKIVYHNGWWKGFRSYLIRSITQNKTVIVLTTLSRRSILDMHVLMDLCGIDYK